MNSEMVTVVLDGEGTVSCFWLCYHVLESRRWPPNQSVPDDPQLGTSKQAFKFDLRFYNEIHSARWHSKTSRECLCDLNATLCVGWLFSLIGCMLP
jgi:hypothetical protein